MKLSLPVPHPLEPMEASTTDALPEPTERPDGSEASVLYEPKWDGFRCLVFRDGDVVELQSKSSKSLTRYFPEIVDAVRALRPPRFVLDGELAVPADGRLSFDALLQRIHPAETRVRKLARETPAELFLFDLLATGEKTSLVEVPLADRRRRLEEWAERYLDEAPAIHLSPATLERREAAAWLADLTGVDGVMVKALDRPYLPGSRDAMVKVKRYRSADCVVGGFRRSSSGPGLGSLLLGLYDDGLLHHVGYTSSFGQEEGEALLKSLQEGPGFTGKAPGGPSRWSRGKDRSWEPVRPEVVVEVRYDHVSGGRFRHGTKLLRVRPDKAPEQCTLDQIRRMGEDALTLLREGGRPEGSAPRANA
jgi:ATP-dependent DNA ligase